MPVRSRLRLVALIPVVVGTGLLARRLPGLVGDAEAAPGELTMSIRAELLDIQYGRKPDVHGWLTCLVPAA